MDIREIDTWTDDKVDNIFNYLLDEYSHSEAEELRKKYVTRDEKIGYLKMIETRFRKYFK